jgi:predicted amidohydrolase YtcJ
MAPIEPLTLAWVAVNRVTSENSRFSQDQRIDAYSAMKAITITAARTINLENTLGSIKTGKAANFVILAENPLKIDPISIKDVKVLETVFKGESFPIEIDDSEK